PSGRSLRSGAEPRRNRVARIRVAGDRENAIIGAQDPQRIVREETFAMPKWIAKWIALAALVVVTAAASSMNASAQTPEQQQACQMDAQTFCQEAIPDHSRVRACLLRNRRQISPACQAVLARSGGGSRRHHRTH